MAHPGFSLTLDDARLEWNGLDLQAATRRMQRVWEPVPTGLATRSLGRPDGKPWSMLPGTQADWHIRGVTDLSDGQLVAATGASVAKTSRQSAHLMARLTFRHETPGFDVTWVLKLWPGAPGTWTCLLVKPVKPFDREKDFHLLPSYIGKAWGERVPLSLRGLSAEASGLYCDSQHRHFDHTPMLRRETVEVPAQGRRSAVEWANLITVANAEEGLTLVKESHKCVNSEGIDTGAFLLGDTGISVTGLGISHHHYGGTPWWAKPEGVETWATWTVLHPADPSRASLEVKRMDRLRYPFQLERDGMVMCNTWGSAGSWTPWHGKEGAPASTEEGYLLREIKSAADLGVDILQIDNGWSYAPGDGSPDRHAPERPWTPHPDRLPGGWKTVSEAARTAGIDLGLWFPYDVARQHPEKVLANQKAGGFRRFKFDFMNMHTPDDIETLRETMAGLLDRAAPHTGINFDLTEANTRVGYFFAREFGNLFFANRENGPGPMTHGSHIAYTPRLALREYWQLAHVVNLNQVQLTVQDKDTIPVGESNAKEYSHGYALAMALMGVPLLFLETATLSEKARSEWKPLLAAYRKHREVMWNAYVFPIGEEPDDRQITGFQCHDPETGSGHVLLFREIHCKVTQKDIPLHFLVGKTLSVSDVLSGEESEVRATEVGHPMEVSQAGGFRWLKYATVDT